MAAFAPALLDVSRLNGSADDVCDQLLDHMLDCDRCLDGCLDGREQTCTTYDKLQEQIIALGGAKTPLIIAM